MGVRLSAIADKQLVRVSFLSRPLRCGVPHRRGLWLVSARTQEARAIHEGATEGTRARVLRQQIYHEGQKEEDICPDQPV